MDFYAILDQVVDLLRQRQRMTYRALQRQFQMDDAFLEDVKVGVCPTFYTAFYHDCEPLPLTC